MQMARSCIRGEMQALAIRCRVPPESSRVKEVLRVWALGRDSRVSSRRIRELPPLIPRPQVWPVRLATFPTPKPPRRAFQRPPSDRVVGPSLGEVRLLLEHGGVLSVHDLRAASLFGHVNLVVVREVVVALQLVTELGARRFWFGLERPAWVARVKLRASNSARRAANSHQVTRGRARA